MNALLKLTSLATMCLLLACHVSLVQADGGKDDDRETTADDVSDLPAPKTILDRSLDAMGGLEAIQAIESSMMRATMMTPIGKVQMEAYFTTPDRFLIKQIITGLGEVGMGSNGTTAWILNPMEGYQLLESDDVAGLVSQASIHNIVLRMKDDFKQLKTVDRTMFREQMCYKISASETEDGDDRQYLYFNTETYLLAGVESRASSFAQSTRSVMAFEKWRTQDGITLFRQMIITEGNRDMTMTIEEIEFNSVDPAMFVLPSTVQRLAEERQARKEAETQDTKDE